MLCGRRLLIQTEHTRGAEILNSSCFCLDGGGGGTKCTARNIEIYLEIAML